MAIFVTNHSSRNHRDSYAYRDYDFPIGETVEISEQMARYMFAHGVEDKEPTLARLGWIRTRNEIPDGVKLLEQFIISQEPPGRNHSKSPVVERVPFPAERRGRGNVKAAA